MGVIIEPGAISAEHASRVIDLFEKHRASGTPTPAQDGPSTEIGFWTSPGLLALSVADIISYTLTVAHKAYGDPIHPEAAYVTWLGPGAHHTRHADNVRPDGNGGWEPNHTPQRAASAVCYLNRGTGAICFVDGTVVEPATGLLVVFESGAEYEHWTEPVTSLEGRYAVPMWFTRDHRVAMHLR